MTDELIIDRAVFDTLKDVMEDEFALVVDAFRSQAKEVWPEAQTALAKGELEGLQRIAHSFKGSALSLGAAPLSQALQALETAASLGSTTDCHQHHQLAAQALDQTLQWLDEELA